MSATALAGGCAPRTSRAERCFDVAITIAVLPFCLVVAAVIAIAIYIDSPGPVFYRSRRVGRDGEPFEMIKFRKMRSDVEGHPVTLDNDERFTPIGRFLSATRLDELPQVWNVLRGEMRIVGPRPEVACFVAQYAADYEEILSVTPGITGDAQLLFVDEKRLLRGPDPVRAYANHVLPAKIEIDLNYVRTRTVRHDLMIVLRTIALPLALLVARARVEGSVLRSWAPAATAAALLTLAFMVASSQVG